MTAAKEPYDPEVAAQVLNLRRGGVPFDVIADRLDLTPETAKAFFDKALGAADPEFLRLLETDRMDRLHAAVWPMALKGDVGAVDRVIRISERRERVSSLSKVNDHAMRKAFDLAATSSANLNPNVDAALVEAGRKIADRVDHATATAEGVEVTKALYLVPHMLNVLREMLATPASRQAVAETTPPPQEGSLAKLRAVHNP